MYVLIGLFILSAGHALFPRQTEAILKIAGVAVGMLALSVAALWGLVALSDAGGFAWVDAVPQRVIASARSVHDAGGIEVGPLLVPGLVALLVLILVGGNWLRTHPAVPAPVAPRRMTALPLRSIPLPTLADLADESAMAADPDGYVRW